MLLIYIVIYYRRHVAELHDTHCIALTQLTQLTQLSAVKLQSCAVS